MSVIDYFRINMGSGDNIPSAGFGDAQSPFSIRRRHHYHLCGSICLPALAYSAAVFFIASSRIWLMTSLISRRSV